MVPLVTPADHAAAFALALPDDVAFSHTTAARLWGMPLPRSVAADEAFHVTRDTSRPRIVRRGCVSHKGLERREVALVDGLRATSPMDTWLDLVEAWYARIDIDDAVMMGDAVVELLHPSKFVHDDHPQADPVSPRWWRDPVNRGCDELLVRFLDRQGFRGRAAARRALELVRPRVWSPMESYSRVALVGGGLPEPMLNLAIRSRRNGGLIAIGDLVWQGSAYRENVVGEYNGLSHEEQRSREADHAKRLRLEDEGWKIVEIYSRDIFDLRRRRLLVDRIGGWLGT